MKVYCEACKCEAEIENQGITNIENILPRRWKRRIIDNRAYILCDICGHPQQMLGGGLSPYIRDALNLGEHAIVEDLPEKEDFYAPRANKK